VSADVDQIASVAKAWEAACRSTDSERIVSLLADDATVWYNFDKDRVHDRAGYRAILDSSAKSFRNQQYKDMRVHLHASGFVEQATLVGETDKDIVETPFLLVATVRGDKIARIEEYFDTTAMKALEAA
jgi:ketosteroid isomerase-like protein